MNQKGYSWIEALFTLTIVTIIFGTLLPTASFMTQKLHDKRYEMMAAASLYQAAIAYRSHGQTEGKRTFDRVQYNWQVNENELCVTYDLGKEERERCI